MEARAVLSGPSVSKTFVAAVLVIVALGLAAMGGYLARGLSSGSGAATQSKAVVNAAPAELPGYVIQETAPKATPRILEDDPNFIAQYAGTSEQVDEGYIGDRGGHGQLP